MKKCPHCTAEIPADVAFCPECGKRLEPNEQVESLPTERTCSSCGAALASENTFCPSCGAKVAAIASELVKTTDPGMATQPPESPSNPNDAYRDLVKQVYHDGEMDRAESAKLAALRGALGIPGAAAQQVEAEVRQEMEQAGRPRTEYVKLEIDANSVLYRNKRNVVEFRLTNLTSHPIEGTHVKVACEAAKNPAIRPVRGRIQPKEERTVPIDLEPEKDGRDLLDIRLEYHAVGGEAQYLLGEAVVTIFDLSEMRSDASSNISIKIDAENMTAVDMSKFITSDTAGKSRQEILDSMRKHEQPIWFRVDLYPDEDRIAAEPPVSKVRFIEPVADILPQTAIRLEVISPAGLSSSRLWVFSQPEIRLGRRKKSDIRLLIEPLDDERNVELSTRISGDHLRLHYTERGCFVEDVGSTNGTEVSSRAGRLPANERVPLESGDEINVAQVLQLRVDAAQRGEQDELLIALRQLPSPWPALGPEERARPFGLSSPGRHQWIRFRRSNPTGDEYLVLICAALIGSGSECAWVLEHPSVAKHHARMVYHHERYWLHPVAEGATTMVNGKRLGARDVAVLRDAAQIQLGEVEIEAVLPE